MKNTNQVKTENGKMRFYHFTRPIHLPSIIHQGIDRGEVPVTPLHAINFPWLTTNPDCVSIGPILESLGQGGSVLPMWASKTGVRLEIELDERDPKLVMWQSYASRLCIRKDWYNRLTETRQWGTDWYVHRGVIGFENITGAFFPATGETLTAEEVRSQYGAGEKDTVIRHPPVVWVTESQAFSLKTKDFELADDPLVRRLFFATSNRPSSIGDLRQFARQVKAHYVFARAA